MERIKVNIMADKTLESVSAIINSKINSIGLPNEYVEKLKELYKISLILKSSDCSNYDAYSILFAKKYVEICQQGDEIIKQINNATPEQLQEYIAIFEKETNYYISRCDEFATQEKYKEMWESTKLYFQSGNLDMIKYMITSHIAFNTTERFEYETFLRSVEQLSEEQLQDVMKLDIDSELQKIISFGTNRTDYSNDYNCHLSSCYDKINEIGYNNYTLRWFHQPINDVASNLKYTLNKTMIETNSSPKL